MMQAPIQTAKTRADVATPVIAAIATAGRRDIALATLRHLASLTDAPDKVLVSIANPDDFDTTVLPPLPFPLEVITAAKGLCAQRNAVLETVPPYAIVLFIDDDFLLAEGYVAATRQVFADHPEVAMATGLVLADGILGPGYDHATGLRLLAKAAPSTGTARIHDTYNGYGCNMAIRAATVAAHDLRFDTALPRYGWLEDVDFSRRLAAHGRIVRHPSMQGVHLGTKTGRSRGVPLGYSQIANPVCLLRKGTMERRRAWRLMTRNVAANLVRTFRPEPWVDRAGRLRGNMMALRDLLTGRLSPERILDL